MKASIPASAAIALGIATFGATAAHSQDPLPTVELTCKISYQVNGVYKPVEPENNTAKGTYYGYSNASVKLKNPNLAYASASMNKGVLSIYAVTTDNHRAMSVSKGESATLLVSAPSNTKFQDKTVDIIEIACKLIEAQN